MVKLEMNNFMIPTLVKNGIDLTEMAEQGKLNHVIGRHKEIERVQQILCKRTKNYPCLVGDPGVGKTAIVEGLARDIVNGSVSSKLLRNKVVFTLNIGPLIACTKFVERLGNVLEEVRQSNGSIILFIDDLHTLLHSNAAGILKAVLVRGELKCIGAMTPDEYLKYVEKDTALNRLFQKVDVHEPMIGDAIDMLERSITKYEEFHGVQYVYNAVNAAVVLSKEYISDGFLPTKAMDVIDEAGARVKQTKIRDSQRKRIVTKKDIHEIISMITGIPVANVSHEALEDRFFEQDEALKEVTFRVGNH